MDAGAVPTPAQALWGTWDVSKAIPDLENLDFCRSEEWNRASLPWEDPLGSALAPPSSTCPGCHHTSALQGNSSLGEHWEWGHTWQHLPALPQHGIPGGCTQHPTEVAPWEGKSQIPPGKKPQIRRGPVGSHCWRRHRVENSAGRVGRKGKCVFNPLWGMSRGRRSTMWVGEAQQHILAIN